MIHIGAHNLHPPSLIAGQTGPFFFVLFYCRSSSLAASRSIRCPDRSAFVHGYTAPPKNRNNNNNNNGEYSLQVLNRFNKKSSSGLLQFLSLRAGQAGSQPAGLPAVAGKKKESTSLKR